MDFLLYSRLVCLIGREEGADQSVGRGPTRMLIVSGLFRTNSDIIGPWRQQPSSKCKGCIVVVVVGKVLHFLDHQNWSNKNVLCIYMNIFFYLGPDISFSIEKIVLWIFVSSRRRFFFFYHRLEKTQITDVS